MEHLPLCSIIAVVFFFVAILAFTSHTTLLISNAVRRTPNEFPWIQVAGNISTLLSFICSAFVIGSFFLFEALRKKAPYKLVLCLVVDECIRNIAKNINDYDETNESMEATILCKTQAFLINYGGVSMFCWMSTISIAIIICVIAGYSLNITNKQIALLMLNNYGVIPIIFSIVPLIKSSYGHSGRTYCWIKNECHLDKLFIFLCYYLHLVISEILSITAAIVVCCKCRKDEDKTLKAIKQYPLCIICSFTFALISRMMEVITDHPAPTPLKAMSVIGSGLFGVFVFVIYARIGMHIKAYCLCLSDNHHHNGSTTTREEEQTTTGPEGATTTRSYTNINSSDQPMSLVPSNNS